MDLQGTKEARTQEDGAEGPLDGYKGGTGRSKDYHKNEGRDAHNHENSTNVRPLRRRQAPFTYPPGTRPSNAQSSTASRPRDPSPSPEAISIPQSLGLSSRARRLLCKARRHPPVTKKTLSELDLPCIMSNINLRMDANFDRDLHFKPDLDGEKGRRKRKEAADYWDSMTMEIAIYNYWAAHPDHKEDDEPNEPECSRRSFEPRLPAMFETLQEVIKTLVPMHDHPSVMQNLEVTLLMQQVRKGVLDMVALATWMAALLKTHCAPMRDEWADRMVEQITEGSRSQEPKEIVDGLQTLFAILEAMKLDVANHQIRAFRVLLIEDTVPFLQEYFDGKINRGNFQAEPARLWYIAAREKAREEDARKSPAALAEDNIRPVEALFRGIADSLLQFDPPTEFPETLLFDSERLWQLRSTVQNLINLEVAWYIFESYVHTQKRYLSARDETYATFRTRIWSLMEDGLDLDSRSSNPGDNDPDLRGGKRWMQNVRCIALEIARFACAACCLDVVADEVISPIEVALEWHLSNESDLFRYFQTTMREKVLTATLTYARKYLALSPLAICESQRTPPQPTTGPVLVSTAPTPAQSTTSQQYDIERIGMRLAHMGVLHWRVWAPILYLREEIAETEPGAFV